nr:glycoside hydrolase family 97 C-terminal domain-containing protein [Chitinophagaceae bacterium]
GKYEATICIDGVNADNYPSDYILAKQEIRKEEIFKVTMAPGGGFLINLAKRK